MAFDYSKLRGRIVEKYQSQRRFAADFPISERSLSLKLSNQVFFRADEIERCCEMLEISAEEIKSYFFTAKVQ